MVRVEDTSEVRTKVRNHTLRTGCASVHLYNPVHLNRLNLNSVLCSQIATGLNAARLRARLKVVDILPSAILVMEDAKNGPLLPGRRDHRGRCSNFSVSSLHDRRGEPKALANQYIVSTFCVVTLGRSQWMPMQKMLACAILMLSTLCI